MSYTIEKFLQNNFLLIPILFIVGYLIFPDYLYNAYYVSCSSMFTTCAFLYRFDKLVFIMHQKPTYFEKATVFKTQIETNNKSIIDEDDKPEIKLIREVDTYLTIKFRKIFKHVLIIIDSYMCGILAYWIFLHFTTDESDYLVKNIGIFGGYVSLCGKAHVYIGKIILYFLKKNKEKVREKEICKRRRLSDEFNDNNQGSIELTDIRFDIEEKEDRESITNPILVEGYMDYFEMGLLATSGDFTDEEQDTTDEEESNSEEKEEKEEEKEEEIILDIDQSPPKSAMLINKIRSIVMFKKPKNIGYAPNTIIIHY